MYSNSKVSIIVRRSSGAIKPVTQYILTFFTFIFCSRSVRYCAVAMYLQKTTGLNPSSNNFFSCDCKHLNFVSSVPFVSSFALSISFDRRLSLTISGFKSSIAAISGSLSITLFSNSSKSVSVSDKSPIFDVASVVLRACNALKAAAGLEEAHRSSARVPKKLRRFFASSFPASDTMFVQ